jgi:rhodanese-related sulfurtransferase
MNLFSLFFVIPASMKPQSTHTELKTRLDWGEPALTILDARSRESFAQGHVSGAMMVSEQQLLGLAPTRLEAERDIYIYGETNAATATAAAKLREAGYQNVSELLGGYSAWKAAGYPVESIGVAATV